MAEKTRGGRRAGAGCKKGYRAPQTLAKQAAVTQAIEEAGLTAERTKEVIRRVLVADVRMLFDEAGNVLPIHQLSDEGAALIAGFEVVKRNLTSGDGVTDTIIKVKLKDQSRYVEMAAKHFGLLLEKIEHSGGISVKWQDEE